MRIRVGRAGSLAIAATWCASTVGLSVRPATAADALPGHVWSTEGRARTVQVYVHTAANAQCSATEGPSADGPFSARNVVPPQFSLDDPYAPAGTIKTDARGVATFTLRYGARPPTGRRWVIVSCTSTGGDMLGGYLTSFLLPYPAGGAAAGAPIAVRASLIPAVPRLNGTQRLRVSTSPRALCSTYREEPTGGGLELTTSAAPEVADDRGNAEWQWDAKSFGKVTVACDAHKRLGSIQIPYQIRS